MAYFNHAFNKVFIGTGGFITAPGTLTNEVPKGQFTFVDPTTWAVPGNLDPSTTLKCPLVLVSGSIYQNDKIGPFHGGYKESVKSKIINPKYVTDFYRVDPCPLQQATVSVGFTPDTSALADDSPKWAIPGQINCAPDFICGQTYYLRLDLKGSPILRFLSRNSYFTAGAYTGCCPADALTPTLVDPTIVYIDWAKQFLNSPLINAFIQIEIFDYNNVSLGVMTKANVNDAAEDWNTYTPEPSPATGNGAGMYITGAYVDTQFGDCTFYPTDALQAYLEPVKIYASEVDYNGDPCAFASLCVANTCLPIQGSGFGENVVRELILSEGYNQSPFYTGKDLRIREITQGYDVTNTIDRTAQYSRYFIKHSVPRFNNPTGTFDNDQYLLEIVTKGATVTGLDSTGASSNTGASGDVPAFSTINVVSTAGLEPGMTVTLTGGTGTITAGAYILEVVSSTVFTITLGTAVSPVTVTLAADSVLQAENSPADDAFEGFMLSWLSNAGSGCVTLTVYDCPNICTPPTVFD